MKPEIEHVPEFEAGQLLGRAVYRPLFRNDQFLRAWCRRIIPVPRGVVRRYVSNETSRVIWDGYVYADADHQTLNWYIAVESDDSDHPSTVSLTFDGDPVNSIAGSSPGLQEKSGAFDVQGYAEGMYQVVATMTRAGGDVGNDAVGWCRAPHLSYDGALTYTTPDTIVDGTVPAATCFNKWRSNDLYFEAQLSPNHGAQGVARKHIGTELSLEIWNGFDRYIGRRIYYHAKINEYDDEDHNKLQGWYDYDGLASKVKFAELRADVNPDEESYYDLPAATYTAGTVYRVTWVMVRDDSTSTTPKATVVYTMAGPADADTFTLPGELAVEQYVYGDTSGQSTRAELLSTNDAWLATQKRLEYRQYASSKVSYVDLGTSTWVQVFERTGDYLAYRGTGLSLEFGDASTVTLDDYADPGTPYQVLDLRTVDGLLHGMMYEVSSDGGDLQWACEYLEEPR